MRHGTAFHQRKPPSAAEDAAELLAVRRGLIHELMAATCRCGRPKRHGSSFCMPCYRSLPEELGWALYKHIGNGYDEAYQRACRLLDRQSKATSAEGRA